MLRLRHDDARRVARWLMEGKARIPAWSDSPLGWLVSAAALAGVIVVAALVVLVAIWFIAETLWALAVVVVGGAGRLLGRPWTVEATTENVRLTWVVIGRHEALQTVDRIAGMIARGEDPS